MMPPIGPSSRAYFAIAALGCATSASSAQPTCDSIGPDLIIGDLNSLVNYSAAGDIEAFACGHIVCNIGDAPAAYIATTPAHPVFAKNLYHLSSGHADGSLRFEQLGQSWLFHGYFALQMQNCCTDCQAADGSELGVHCSDSNTGAICGTQSGLGPKWQVNPVTGVFSYPPANPAYSGTVARRLQARIPELQPSGANDQYFIEGIVISADDAAAGNGANNASYRPVSLAGSGQNWNLALAGSTVRGLPAIYAWQAADPSVRIEPVQMPDGGWLFVGARVNPLPGQTGFWHYEYAIFNLNSQLAVRSFDAGGPVALEIQSLGFHDVDYHSGDGPGNVNFAGTDWTVSSRLTWETETFDQNQSANALRWGTLYNFRVDVAAPPTDQALVLEVFQPSMPDSVATPPLPAPNLRTGDTNGDGIADLNDLANLLAAFGTCAGQGNFCPDCDFDRNGCIELADLAVLLAWFGR